MAKKEDTVLEGIMKEPESDNIIDDTPKPDGANDTPSPSDKAGKEGDDRVIDEGNKKDVKKSIEDDDASKKKEELPAVDETTKRLDNLEKANKGLLKELGKERDKRQNLEGRLGQVNDFLTTATEKRKQENTPLPPKPEMSDYLQVEFKDDVPIIPVAKIAEIFKQQLAPIHEEFIQSKRTQAGGRKIDQIRVEAQKVIADNEAYPVAMQELERQWQWINHEFGEYVDSGNTPPKSQEEAEEMIFESGIDQAFYEKYPDSDFDSVVSAYMLPENATAKRAGARLRKALKVIAGSNEKPSTTTEKPNQSLAQAEKLGEKSNFADTPNRSQSGKTLTQLAELPMEALLSLNDHEAEKLYDLMEEQ